MNNKDIANLALWTAEAVRKTMINAGRQFDAADEDIVREYIQADLQNWQHGKKIAVESSMQLAKEILARRNHETKNADEVEFAMQVICSKFQNFIDAFQRERDAEAAKIAESMPAIKV